jgi:hypothetical protein
MHDGHYAAKAPTGTKPNDGEWGIPCVVRGSRGAAGVESVRTVVLSGGEDNGIGGDARRELPRWAEVPSTVSPGDVKAGMGFPAMACSVRLREEERVHGRYERDRYFP